MNENIQKIIDHAAQADKELQLLAEQNAAQAARITALEKQVADLQAPAIPAEPPPDPIPPITLPEPEPEPIPDPEPIPVPTPDLVNRLASPRLIIGHIEKPICVYLRWTDVPDAEFYLVERGNSADFSRPVRVFEGAGLDCFDTETLDGTVYYRIKAYNRINDLLGDSDWTIVQVDPKQGEELLLDLPGMKEATVRISGNLALKQDGTFDKDDIGKIINIANARKARWYNRGELCWCGFIIDVVEGAAVLGRVFTMGDPVNELYPPKQGETFAVYGFNAYDAIDTAIKQAEMAGIKHLHVKAPGTVMVDPYRAEGWMKKKWLCETTVKGTGWETTSDLMITGLKAYLAFEDHIGQEDQPTRFAPYTAPWAYTVFTQFGGSLRLQGCQFYGPSNRRRYADRGPTFLKWHNTEHTKQLFIVDCRIGNSLAWNTGLTTLFECKAGVADGKSTIHIERSNLYAGEHISAAYSEQRLSDFQGCRVTIRNSELVGSGFPIHQKPAKGRVKDGVLTIEDDDFTFRYQWLYFQSHIGKTAKIIARNFDGTNIRADVQIIDNYTAKTTALPDGSYAILHYVPADGSETLNGHVLYLNTTCETYIAGNVVSQAHGSFMRRNNPDTWLGTHRQTTLQNIVFRPVTSANNLYGYLADFQAPQAGNREIYMMQHRGQAFNEKAFALLRNIQGMTLFSDSYVAPTYFENCWLSGPVTPINGFSFARGLRTGYGSNHVPVVVNGIIKILNQDTHELLVQLGPDAGLELEGGTVGFTIPGMLATKDDFCSVILRGCKLPYGLFYFGSQARVWVATGEYVFNAIDCQLSDQMMNPHYKRRYVTDAPWDADTVAHWNTSMNGDMPKYEG